MKAKDSAQVQILKNRSGKTMYEPANISVILEAYVATDEDIGFENYSYINGQASIEATFSDFDTNLSDFGIINK